MAGRVAPAVDEARIEMTTDENVGEPSTLLPKVKAVKSVSMLGLWRYSDSLDVVLILFAATASVALGTINPLAIRTLGDLLTQLLTGTSGGAGMYEKAEHFTALGAGAFFATYISRALWIISAERNMKRISMLYLERVLRQDMAWFDKLQGESLTARLSNEVPYIRNGTGETAGLLCSAVGTTIICLVISFLQNWKLTLIILALLPVLVGAGFYIVLNDSKMTKITSDAFAGASGIAEQALSGVRTVYAFSLQKRFTDKYAAKLTAVRDADVRKSAASGFATGIFSCLIFLIFAFAFWWGSQMVIKQEIAAPEAVVVLLSMMILASSLMKVPGALSVMAVAQSAATSVFCIIEKQATVSGGQKLIAEKKRHSLHTVAGNITFSRVSFSYPARPNIPILLDLTLDIKAGSTVAFVGGSGSGKSTTISLLQRFYDVDSGFVAVDGHDVRTLDLGWLRKHIGVVGQEPVLFALTVKQNILMGTHEDVTPAHFVSVCRMAQCHFVEKFPLGYDTPVAPGMLSGGQKQRIAIARALIKNPKILLLDEATSALDTTSERLVQKALDAASEGRTTIVIAHRLSTIRNASVICVMERGVLVEKGTHEELYAKGGVYTQLVNKQKLSVTKSNPRANAELAVTERADELQAPPQAFQSSETIGKILQQSMLVLESPAQLVKETRARFEKEKALHLQLPVENEQGLFKKVYQALRPERKLLILGTACAGLNGLVFPGFAFLLGFIIQEIMQPLHIMVAYGMANMFIGCLLVVAVFALLGSWGQTLLFGKANANLTNRLRLAMFGNILTCEMGFFDSKANAVGTLVNKLGGVSQVPCFVTDVWGGLANLAFTAVYGVGLSLVFCVPLTGVMLCLLPFMFLLAWWQCVAISQYASACKESLDQSTQVATESIMNVKTLKTLAREEFAVRRFAAFLARPFELSMRNASLDSIAYALQSSSIMFTIALGLFVGQKFLEDGTITEFWRITVVILGMCVSMVSLSSSASLAQAWAKGGHAASTTFALLERRTAIDPGTKGHIPKDFRAGFEFKNLVFQYPTATQPIFNGQFTLAGGENKSLALVGPSGCGKSTVIGLLQRWYDPIGGEALLGSIRIADYDIMEGLRSNMALVGQEPVLFDMSIAENIAWGSEKPVTRAEIETAARQANVHTFVMNMPEGYETRVGDKGGHLSGGQKQRIAIARALIRKPKLLLLDEATSALDSASEHEVQTAIDAASVGRTTVTIAHRLSTIKNVDCIAVVTDGQIVEVGRHDELVAQNGVYADLCRKQDL